MELRNPLTRSQLEDLRPRPFVVEFTDADVPGVLFLGKVPATHVIPMCVVEIFTAFDAAVAITVGDIIAQGRFQGAADNHPGVSDQYETHPHFTYSVDTDAYVFLTGSPTIGHGRVILYIQ
jgi:hypothetical protein